MAYTPMIQQYLSIKAQYEDAFLFFRLGDFYEMFFDDAKMAAKELEITLTSRDGGADERIPMCGVPHHSAENYISRLIEQGYKIAICEQMEDPKQAKGMVRREVTQLITPGTVMEGKSLSEKENNFIAALSVFEDDTYGLAINDLTTGENRLTLFSGGWDEVVRELNAVGAKEVVVPGGLLEENIDALQQQLNMTISVEDDTDVPEPFEALAQPLDQSKMRMTFGRLLQYLNHTQKRSLDHLQPVENYQIDQYMAIDLHSKRNLELTETILRKGKKGSLLWLLDETVTAMGARRLKQWIERPLLDQEQIERRLAVVEALTKHFFEREELREMLKGVYDLERLAGRVSYGNVNARDLVQLRRSLERVPAITGAVKKLNSDQANTLLADIDLCEALVERLRAAIVEDPPLSIKEGGIVNDGFNEKLDEYRDASKNGKDWIASLQQQEREATGVKSLKVGYNKVFGYYIEVTRTNLDQLPEGRYERKQTLANAERFITPELKAKETLILEAEEKMLELEYEMFLQIREEVKPYIPSLQKLAKQISEIDALQSFAVISEQQQYVKPEFSDDREVDLKDGRHPVVEKVLTDEEYAANDVVMPEDRDILLITGPNMAGKSTYMRQLALTAILAQIGCFVPASRARLPIFDQVFTRIGAADDLVSGQSTFMVEMLETRYALSKATQNSLILLDEIGRGTSTYDGIALAQAIIEYIHNDIHAKTLFSTHYHELTHLGDELSHLQNIHVGAMEEDGEIVFLHQVKEGAADESYGIHVAQLADLPDEVISRAHVILRELEGNANTPQPSLVNEGSDAANEHRASGKEGEGQLSFFTVNAKEKAAKKERGKHEDEVLKSLRDLDLLSMTPLDAINSLYHMQKSLLKKG